jgi:hypothetical protein
VRSRYYTWRWRQHLFNSVILNLWLGFAFSIQTRVSIFFPTAESFIFFLLIGESSVSSLDLCVKSNSETYNLYEKKS